MGAAQEPMPTKLERDIENQLAMIHDLATKAETWSSRPGWIEFSTNNVCNLRCVMCAQADGLPLMAMAPEEARRFLEQVLPSACNVTPSAISEPFLGNMDLMVELCRKHEVFLTIYTNGTVLDARRFRAMADRIAKLYVSFDSHVPEVFERIRVRAKFDAVVRHIREILPVAAELGVPMGFVFVMMADNTPHLPEYVDYLADLGASEARAQIRVQRLLYDVTAAKERGYAVEDRFTREEICGFLDRAAERARARGVALHVDAAAPFGRSVHPIPPVQRGIGAELLEFVTEAVRRRYPGFCSMAAYYMKVEPDGTVYPCCRQPRELRMGNVREKSVEEIWNGPEYREFRRRMFAGEYPPSCRGCDVLVDNPAFRALRNGERPNGSG